jgi:Glyoxalase/Bleomycin resistance protein/Dioxygenase superfamily
VNSDEGSGRGDALAMHRLYEQVWPKGEYRFFQLGFVVDDVVDAAGKWARVFGVGPFHVLPVIEQQLVVRGEPAPVSVRVAVAQAGPVQIELIEQRDDRPSIFRDWTRGGTCALHQLATVTSDYDSKLAEYERLGYEPAAESHTRAGFRVAYFDTASDFGFYTEVVERTDDLMAQFAAIAETCALWDRTDPVRLLTRDGYRVP